MSLTRKECEAKILEKLKEIEKIVLEYNPDNKYLVMSVRDTVFNANNDYWLNDDGSKNSGTDKPIDFVIFRNEEDEEDE